MALNKLQHGRRYILGFDDGVNLPGRYTFQQARAKASRLVVRNPGLYNDVLIIDTRTERAITWLFDHSSEGDC